MIPIHIQILQISIMDHKMIMLTMFKEINIKLTIPAGQKKVYQGRFEENKTEL